MIAQLALPALRERYDVVALDIRASPGVHQCDLLGPREAIRPFFKGAHAVFHSAFVPPPKDVVIATSSFLASNLKGGSAQEKEQTQQVRISDCAQSNLYTNLKSGPVGRPRSALCNGARQRSDGV